MPKAKLLETLKGSVISLREAKVTQQPDGALEVEAVLITQGKGNETDKHFYTQGFIESAPAIFNGKKCFEDHPTVSEETDHPERSTKKVIGFWKEVRADGGNVVGIHRLPGGPGFARERALLLEAVAYAQQFPGETLVGYSINANGDSEPYDSEAHGGPAELDGQDWTAVTQATECMSIDLVTFPGAGGRPIEAENKESVRALREAMKRVNLADMVGGLQSKIDELSKTGDTPGLKDLKRIAENISSAVKAETEEAKMPKPNKPATPADAHPELQMGEAHKMAAETLKAAAAKCTDESEKSKFLAAAAMHTKAAEAAEAEDEADPPADEAPPKSKATPAGDTPGADDTDGTGVESEEEVASEAGKAPKTLEALRKSREALKAVRAKNAKLAETVRGTLIVAKLNESGLPEYTHKSLALQMRGMETKAMDAFIEAEREKFEGQLDAEFGTHGLESRRGAGADDENTEGAGVSILRENGLVPGGR